MYLARRGEKIENLLHHRSRISVLASVTSALLVHSTCVFHFYKKKTHTRSNGASSKIQFKEEMGSQNRCQLWETVSDNWERLLMGDIVEHGWWVSLTFSSKWQTVDSHHLQCFITWMNAFYKPFCCIRNPIDKGGYTTYRTCTISKCGLCRMLM